MYYSPRQITELLIRRKASSSEVSGHGTTVMCGSNLICVTTSLEIMNYNWSIRI